MFESLKDTLNVYKETLRTEETNRWSASWWLYERVGILNIPIYFVRASSRAMDD